jgi:thiol-disulfide isomerase/thioredoxin
MRLFPVLSIAAVTAFAQTPTISSDRKGKLVVVKNKMVQPIDATPVTQAKYIAFYFGAGWCGPCHKFTPDLVSFYNEMKPKYPGEFEVVFVSEDNNPTEMQKYMNEMSMPWPALRWDAIKWSQASKLAGPGIPSLVVVDSQGKILSNSFEGKNYVGPHKVLNDLHKLLTEGGTAIAAASSSGTVSPSPAQSDWDKFFKKKP